MYFNYANLKKNSKQKFLTTNFDFIKIPVAFFHF